MLISWLKSTQIEEISDKYLNPWYSIHMFQKIDLESYLGKKASQI